MGTVVVRAKHGFETLQEGDRWDVHKGDLGVLRWVAHRRHRRYLEPRVIWDRDPHRKARRVVLSSVAIVGLQTRTLRVRLISLS